MSKRSRPREYRSRFFTAINGPDEAARARMIAEELDVPESSTDEKGGLSRLPERRAATNRLVVLLSAHPCYKMPEGTWLLVILSLASLRFVGRSSAEWAEEITLWTVPDCHPLFDELS